MEHKIWLQATDVLHTEFMGFCTCDWASRRVKTPGEAWDEVLKHLRSLRVRR